MVDRPDPLSRRASAGMTGSEMKAAFLSSRPEVVLAVIAALELAWLGWFLVVPLPNFQNYVVRRGLLLLKTFPEVVPDTSFRESLLGRGLAELSQVQNLPQRVPVVLAAALIAGAAIGLGEAAIALLRLRRRLRSAERIALAYGLARRCSAS